ncbi:MAG: DMT family transporter [Planctomycetales bacterium]|nr:DMT family transporter [Planctomycetales bacterium]
MLPPQLPPKPPPTEPTLNPQQALILALLATCVFASAPSCIRAVHLDAISLGITRLGLASAAMTIVLLIQRKLTLAELRSWSRQTWKAIVTVGLVFGCHWVLFFLSIKIGSAAVGAIGFSSVGVQLLLLGWLLGFSQVTSLDLVGLLLAIVGSILLFPAFSLENEQTVGLAIGILSGTFAAFLPLLHQRHIAVDADLRIWGQFGIGLAVFLILWPYAEWEFHARDTGLILYLGLVVAWLGHATWTRVSTVLSTTTLSILTYLYLPGALMVSFLALGEKLPGRMSFGAGLVLVANALVLISQHRRGALSARASR